MDMKTLLKSVKEAIHDDGDTQAWCSVNYSRRHKVYVGVDRRKPPDEDDCPLVSVFPIGKIAGMELEVMDHMIGVSCVLYDADTETVARDYLVEKEIIGNLIDFTEYVREVITGLSLTGLSVNQIDTEYEVIEAFPYMVASMEVKLSHDYYQGEADYFD